ncbi:hypothetical protein BER11_25350 [Escherichia coli]|nr:hypothetical protein [Escherichia coli]PDV14913.1 hypothetical protein BER11_25350 [Escherichia coli]PSX66534.1 hypothetical protein C7U77_21640 [Escherichia coli]PSX81001.1 hypothetical protein C7U70_24175 [Escherichia coli]PSX86325.1 hypothetical protein C7U80_26155 [Escherichia coli]
MSVLRIRLSRTKGLIHENDVHSLALASTESMVVSSQIKHSPGNPGRFIESIRNIHAEDKIFSIFI